MNGVITSSIDDQIQTKRNKTFKSIIIIVILILLLTLSVVAFCVYKFHQNNKSRTVMIYMVGSDLESENGLATYDLNGISYEKVTEENINVVLIAGGSKKWNNDYINEDETSIYELTEEGFKVRKKQSQKNMGEASTLSDFLNYTYDAYKTDEYDLIFWNHGGAILGSEFDELYNDDMLELEEIKSSLESTSFNNKNKLEVIIFSTCLNGTLEVADTLKEFSDYLVASEEVTLGYKGNSVLKVINDFKKSDNGYDIGKKYVDEYKDYIGELKQINKFSANSIYSTYSVVDLSKINELEEYLTNFINDIDLASNYNYISRVRSNLYQYAYSNGSDSGIYDTIDLYNFVEGIKDLSPHRADEFLNVFEETVVYNYATNPKSRGLSIYFPFNGSDSEKKYILDLYDDFEDIKVYGNFISTFYDIQSSLNNNYSFSKNKVIFNDNGENSDFSLELTSEQKETFAKATYTIFKDMKDGYYIPVYVNGNAELSGNKLSANIKDRQLKITSTFEDIEYIPRLFEVEENNNIIKYRTNVVLENFDGDEFNDWRFDNASLTLIYDKNTDEISLDNVIITNDDEKASNILIDLDDYTHIVFASSKYKIFDENGNYSEDWESNKIIEGIETEIKGIVLNLNDFNDGYDYYCVFKIWDTNNDVYYSNLVKMN